LNQQRVATATPSTNQFYTDNTTTSVSTFRFNYNARIGTVSITNGFNNYYEVFSNTTTICTFIELNGTSWAVYRFPNFTEVSASSYWEVKGPNFQNSSVGFTFGTNTYYCIYMQLVI
jgi:hypothetical protein